MKKIIALIVATFFIQGCQNTQTQSNYSQNYRTNNVSATNDAKAFSEVMACGMDSFIQLERMYNRDPDFVAAIMLSAEGFSNNNINPKLPSRLKNVLDSYPNPNRKIALSQMVLTCDNFNPNSFKNPSLMKTIAISLSQRRRIANEIMNNQLTVHEAFVEIMRIEQLLTDELMGTIGEKELMSLMQGMANSSLMSKMNQMTSVTNRLEARISSDYGL